MNQNEQAMEFVVDTNSINQAFLQKLQQMSNKKERYVELHLYKVSRLVGTVYTCQYFVRFTFQKSTKNYNICYTFLNKCLKNSVTHSELNAKLLSSPFAIHLVIMK